MATTVLGKSIIAPPGVGNTQTFITIGAFDTELEALNCQKYINTKFARMMLSILKVTQHNPPATWANVPMQDFTANSDIDWTKPLPVIDQQLYYKYGLDFSERYFIESMIDYREDLPAEWFWEYYLVVATSDESGANAGTASMDRNHSAGRVPNRTAGPVAEYGAVATGGPAERDGTKSRGNDVENPRRGRKTSVAV